MSAAIMVIFESEDFEAEDFEMTHDKSKGQFLTGEQVEGMRPYLRKVAIDAAFNGDWGTVKTAFGLSPGLADKIRLSITEVPNPNGGEPKEKMLMSVLRSAGQSKIADAITAYAQKEFERSLETASLATTEITQHKHRSPHKSGIASELLHRPKRVRRPDPHSNHHHRR